MTGNAFSREGKPERIDNYTFLAGCSADRAGSPAEMACGPVGVRGVMAREQEWPSSLRLVDDASVGTEALLRIKGRSA